MTTHRGLGTLMRHVLELLDGDVARVYADLGVPDYRPRYSPGRARPGRARPAVHPGPTGSSASPG